MKLIPIAPRAVQYYSNEVKYSSLYCTVLSQLRSVITRYLQHMPTIPGLQTSRFEKKKNSRQVRWTGYSQVQLVYG